uniref:Uncharacterized protein n=1 Tax=Rhizophora mucronata TaxID=61149 RepID=A0A2P2IRM3_RHIMU
MNQLQDLFTKIMFSLLLCFLYWSCNVLKGSVGQWVE